MAYNPSKAQSEMLETFYNLLPDVFTQRDSGNEGILNSFINSLAGNEGNLLVALHDFKDNLNVLTSSSGFIETWEELAGLSPKPDLDIVSRRARVFSRISGTDPTLANLKTIIRNYTDEDNFEVFEYYTLGDPLSAFVYEVRLTTPALTNLDEDSLILDLNKSHPAHCILARLVDVWPIADDILTITESSSASVSDLFIIGSSLIGGTDVIGSLDAIT